VPDSRLQEPAFSDACFQLLIQQTHKVDGPQLIIADENLKGAPLQLLPTDNITLVTNRYDLHQQAKASDINSYYSDFDFSSFADKSFDQVLYRVSKEKPVTHHIINSAHRLLNNAGTLAISGEKNDGIKTYADKASRYFSSPTTTKKHGNSYLAVIHHLDSKKCPLTEQRLDDKDYQQLRACIPVDDQLLFSKPGLFGWNKVDQGSAFLADYLPDFFSLLSGEPNQILDLGCGYGYLSVMVSQQTKAHIIATDNNAAAITACTQNFSLLGINGEVIAGDCADSINQQFDAIICNPPFHQGFGTDSQLTQRFITTSYKRLNPGGQALFVTNRFVPIESCAEKLFKIRPVAENKSFKLIRLIKD